MRSSDYLPSCVSTAPGQCRNTGNSELSNMYRFHVEIPEIRFETKMGESTREEREGNSTSEKSGKRTLERLASPLELSSRSAERIA